MEDNNNDNNNDIDNNNNINWKNLKIITNEKRLLRKNNL